MPGSEMISPHVTSKMDWTGLQMCGLKCIFLTVSAVVSMWPGTEATVMMDNAVTSSSPSLPTPTDCPPGYMFCFDNDICININDGTCLPKCETHERLEPTDDGHYECVDDTLTGDDGDNCEEYECQRCDHGQVFCFEAGTCVDIYEELAVGEGICLPQQCDDGEALCYIGDTPYCEPKGVCDYDEWVDDDEGCSGDECTKCYAGQVFCIETGICIDTYVQRTDGVGICLPQECGMGEVLCYNDDTSYYCDPRGYCGDDDGNDREEECTNGQCTKCSADQVFCFEIGQCVDRHSKGDDQGKCKCADKEEACWSTGQEVCVPVETCPMNRVRLVLGTAIAKDLSADLRDHIATQFVTKFQASPTAIPMADFDDGLIHLDLLSSLPLELMRHKVAWMVEARFLKDLSNIPLAVAAFVVEPCKDSKCAFGETEAACVTENQIWCQAVSLCLDKTSVCPGPPIPGVFYLRQVLGAKGVFEPCPMHRKVKPYVTLERMGGWLKEIMAKLLIDLVTVKRLVVLPGDADTDRLVMIAQLLDGDNDVADSKLMDRLAELELTGDIVQHFSIVQEGEPTLVKVQDDATRTYLHPQPLAAGVDQEIDLSHVPANHLHMPVTIDCTGSEQKIQLLRPAGSYGFERRLESMSEKIVAKYTGSSFDHAKCVLTSTGSSVQTGLRFLLVPHTLEQMARVRAVSLSDAGHTLQLQEDDKCHHLPDDMFTFTFPDTSEEFLRVLGEWPMRMTELEEHWVGAADTVERLTVGLRGKMMTSIATLKATVTLQSADAGARMSSVSVYLKDRFVQERDLARYKLGVLGCHSQMKLCPKRNLNTDSTLTLTPHLPATGTLSNPSVTPLTVNIQVAPVNDPPMKRRRKSQSVSHLTFPRVPIENDPAYTDPDFDVCEIAAEWFYDIDLAEDQELGLAAMFFNSPETVAGEWLWSKDNGVTWSPIPEFTYPYRAVFLECSKDMKYMIKFQPEVSMQSYSWTREEGPQLKLAGWDMDNKADLDGHHIIDVQIDCQSDHVAYTNVYERRYTEQSCLQGAGSSVSPLVNVTLERLGCDNKPMQGQTMMACGCDRPADFCTDCNGEVNGEATLDICGRCVGGTTGLAPCTTDVCLPDCSATDCYNNNVKYCLREEIRKKRAAETCAKEGGVVNPLYGKDSCTKRCIPDEQVDDECYMCGENICEDCAGVVGGNKVENLCKQCVAPENFDTGCSIGDFQPKYVYNAAFVNITARVPASLDPNADLECQFIAIDNSPELVTPAVVGNPIFLNSDEHHTVTLQTSVPSADLSLTLGRFSVTCTLDGSVLPGSTQTVTRFGHPVLSSITPAEAMHSSLGEDTVTITGTGFVDTGVVRLIIECDETSRDVWACQYGIPGEFVSETEVRFKMAHLRKLKAGLVYKVNVILGWKKHVDLASLPAPKEFTVRAPAPLPEHAVLDPNGCNKLRIRFNRAISGADSPDCSNYFTNSQLAGGECWVNGRYLMASYSTKIASGTVLTFKEGVVKYAGSEIADTLSGTVVVDRPEPKHVPQVKLVGNPRTVGCQAVRFATDKINTHCFNVDVSWTVEAINNDLTDQSLQDNLVELNDYLADKHDFFYLKANQLLDGWRYIITMTWSIENDLYGGSVSRFLKKDESAIATANIFGLSDDVDPAKQTKIQAKIQGCMSSLSEKPKVRWTVTGPIVINDLSPKTTIWIPANTLLYSSDYNITLEVTINGEAISTTMSFRSKEGELEAAISYAGDTSSNAVEVMDDEDVALECSNKAETATAATTPGSSSETKCFWFCADNYYSDSSDEFMPCYDNDGAYVTRTGAILSLPSADRKKPMDWDYRQKWTLIMNSGTQESNTSRIITYKSIEQALALLFGMMNILVPQITLLSPDFITVSDTDRITIIHALCLSGTKFVWEGNTDDEEFGPLTWKSYDKPYRGRQRPLGRDVDRFSSCSTRLPLAWLALTPGEIYSLKLTLTNQFTTRIGNFSLAATKTVYVQMIPIPKPGLIEIYPAEGPYVAMETNIDVMLTGWDDALSCDVYFFDDTRRKKVNVMSDAPDIPTMGLTMPEGVFKFEATCCNSYGACAEHQTGFTVTVDSLVANEIANLVNMFIMNLQLNLDLLLMVGDMLDTLATAASTDPEKDTMKNQVKSVANKEMTSMFETSMENDNPKEKAAVLSNSKEIVKGMQGGQSLEEDTRYSMRAAARDVVSYSTGRRRSWRHRQKRSSEKGTGNGLTTEAAVDVLDVYALSLVDEYSLTQEEAVEFSELLDEVMVGMCIKQAETGTMTTADGTHVDVRLHRTATNGTADMEFDVGCGDCATFPAKVVYGSDIEDAYDSSWNSSAYTLEDICIASAQMAIDMFTPSVNVDTPARVSNIVLLRMLHPITYTTRSHDSLADPVQVQLMIENSTMVNVTTYDYKCKMWESPVWSDSKCTSSEPQLVGDDYRVVCSCTTLGVVSVFEQLKVEEEDTTTSTTADTTVANNQQRQPTATPAPSKPVAAWAQWLKIEFSFVESFDTITDITMFLSHLRNQLITLTRYTADNIKNLKVSRGSIVVTFELHSTGVATLGQMAYVVDSVINSGSTSFTAPGGGALTIIPGSFSYTDQKVDDKDDNHTKDLLPYIIGGSLGGLTIIGLVIIVVVLIMKSNSSKTAPITQPAQPTAARPDSHPPEYIPNYALPPPPPYMYEQSPLDVAFPKTNKWVENELTPVKAGDVEKHKKTLEGELPTNSRDNSNLSIETNTENKEKEKAPTPVAWS